jgi:hypothetical protein
VEEELELLYNTYYEELEQHANYMQRHISSGETKPPPPRPGPFPGSVEQDEHGALIVHNAPCTLPNDKGHQQQQQVVQSQIVNDQKLSPGQLHGYVHPYLQPNAKESKFESEGTDKGEHEGEGKQYDDDGEDHYDEKQAQEREDIGMDGKDKKDLFNVGSFLNIFGRVSCVFLLSVTSAACWSIARLRSSSRPILSSFRGKR